MESQGQDRSENTSKEDVQPSQQEEVQYDGGADHSSSGRNSYLISYFACEKISWATQILVFLIAIWHIIQMILYFQEKYTTDFNLESKETMVMDEPWFNFAICVRPLLLPGLLEGFFTQTGLNFTQILEDAHMDHKSLIFNKTTTLDSDMFPDEFEEYFRYIHPWDKISSADALYEFRKENIKSRIFTIEVNHGKINITDKGEFSLSPVYGVCLNLTVSEPMSKHPMEITVQMISGSKAKSLSSGHDSKSSDTEYVDFFLYGQNDTFTEIQSIKKEEAFTFSLKNYHRVSVKGSKRTRKGCKVVQDYSKTNCLYWCKMQPFLNSVPCSLPWMREIVEKHPGVARARLPCRRAQDFLAVLKMQKQFLKDKSTKNCKCPDDCFEWDISMFSLGVDHNSVEHGIYFVVSPEITTVKQHDDEKLLPIVGELCATLSFLFGLTFIMVYDWLVVILLWLFGLFTNVHDAWRWPLEAWDQYDEGDYGNEDYYYDDYDYDEDNPLSSYDILNENDAESFIWHKQPEMKPIESSYHSKSGIVANGAPSEQPPESERNVPVQDISAEQPAESERNGPVQDTQAEQPPESERNVAAQDTQAEQPPESERNLPVQDTQAEQPTESERNVVVQDTSAEQPPESDRNVPVPDTQAEQPAESERNAVVQDTPAEQTAEFERNVPVQDTSAEQPTESERTVPVQDTSVE